MRKATGQKKASAAVKAGAGEEGAAEAAEAVGPEGVEPVEIALQAGRRSAAAARGCRDCRRRCCAGRRSPNASRPRRSGPRRAPCDRPARPRDGLRRCAGRSPSESQTFDVAVVEHRHEAGRRELAELGVGRTVRREDVQAFLERNAERRQQHPGPQRPGRVVLVGDVQRRTCLSSCSVRARRRRLAWTTAAKAPEARRGAAAGRCARPGAQAVANSLSRVVAEAGVQGGEDHRLGVVADRDDEGEAELLDVGGVELGELAALVVGQRVEAGGRLLGGRGFGQALGGGELAGKIGVGGEDAQALVLRWPCGTGCAARNAGPTRCRWPGRVRRRRRVRRSTASARRSSRNGRRTGVAVHLRGDEVGRHVGVMLRPSGGRCRCGGRSRPYPWPGCSRGIA